MTLRRCVVAVGHVWLVWYAVLLSFGGGMGTEKAYLTFVRLSENLANPALLMDLVGFLLGLAGLLILMAVLVFAAASGLRSRFDISEWHAILVATVLLVVPVWALNSILYPISVTAVLLPPLLGYVLVVVGLLGLLAFAILGLLRVSRARSVGLVTAVAVTLVWWMAAPEVPEPARKPMAQRGAPNVIILGMDALRPSELAYFGNSVSRMPFIDELLGHAEVMESAYTPIARTHSAWVSILSGRYPLHTGARFNIVEDHFINMDPILPRVFNGLGYHTVWGLDERRFNDIDERYGFDRVVGPEVGAADFMITRVSDVPPLNLIANTGLAKRLFPYVYINRGNSAAYVPYVFNEELVSAAHSDRPVFMAAHLCLAHYPFISNLMKRIEDVDREKLISDYPNYLSMIDLVDRQMKDLFDQMYRAGLLNNAVVYLMSDHGEAFADVDTNPQSGNPYADFNVTASGHGTSVMMPSQYRVLLAKLRFRDGQVVSTPARRDRLSSLIDIAPDIVETLDLSQPFPMDGRPFSDREGHDYVFIESSFYTEAVGQARINELVLLQQSINSYKVNEQGRLRLKPEMVDALTRSKQRAVISRDDKLVAFYPDEKSSALAMDMQSMTWWPTVAYVPEEMDGWQDAARSLCEFLRDDPHYERGDYCDEVGARP